MIPIKKPFEEILIDRGLLRAEDVVRAKSAALTMKTSWESALVQWQLITESDLMTIRSESIGVDYIPLRGKRISPELLELVPTRIAYHYGLFPIDYRNEVLVVAMVHPEDQEKVDEIRSVLQRDVLPVLAGELEIQDALKTHYGVGAETLEELNSARSLTTVSAVERRDDLKTLSEDASVIKFVNELLLETYESRATDIHLEPYDRELRIRRRIDGVLFDTPVPPSIRHFQAAIISRIKVMADLDIGERRLPQDGRMDVRIGHNTLDMRVSTLPTPFGESVMVRLLTSKMFLDLEHLGFFAKDMAYLESVLEKPHGIVLLTGPTGSGKTTTLYSFLSKINRENNKIITIEDPIEYQIRGITQIQVQPKIGLDFGRGLRSMLRHDPDVMMVGEIRDLETAEIAIRVALTGHLVFSTLHTNDAPGAVTRLVDMGLEPFLIASSLECVIAQRLVRVICAHCKEQDPASPERVFRGRGCEHCRLTGYRGRTGIYEILNIDGEIRDLILKRASADDVRKKAQQRGMRTLQECGWEKIHAGFTTPAEVMRVTMRDADA